MEFGIETICHCSFPHMIRKNQSITLEVQAAWWKEKERKRENVPMGLLGLDQSPGDARRAPFFEGFPRLNVRKFVTEDNANASPVCLLFTNWADHHTSHGAGGRRSFTGLEFDRLSGYARIEPDSVRPKARARVKADKKNPFQALDVQILHVQTYGRACGLQRTQHTQV